MTRQTRQGHRWARVGGLAALTGMLVLLQAEAADGPAGELIQQHERQRQIQADTDRMVRQMETTLQVLQFYKLDKGSEQELLAEAATALTSLSSNQMTEVLRRLEKAGKTDDEKSRARDKAEAYARHREIVLKLKELVARRDAVHSLEEGAERLEKAAALQLEQHLVSRQSVHAILNAEPNPEKKGVRPIAEALQQHRDQQDDLRRDIETLFGKLSKLEAVLPTEEKDRLKSVLAYAEKLGLLANMRKVVAGLQTTGTAQAYQNALDLQQRSATDLLQLAHKLRGQGERLAALREARERIGRALTNQEAVQKQTQNQPDAKTRQDLADQQTRLAFDAHAISDLLREPEANLAEKINSAEKAMQNAVKEMTERNTAKAVAAQKQAQKELTAVLEDLNQAIARAEKEKNDPLTGLKNALETVEKLQTDQKEARNRTVAAEQNKDADQLAKEANKQQELAQRTDDLKQQALAAKPETRPMLEKAAQTMQEAAKALKDKKAAEASGKQKEAIQSLEEARQQLEDKVAEIQKRREEIAQLEKTAQQLAELATREKAIADQAQEMARLEKSEAAKDLAKKQEELTPEARAEAKKVEKAAPEVGKKVKEAVTKMEAARAAMDNKQMKAAAKEAEEAARKLEEAEKKIAMALDEMKNQETIDQAQAQENPMETANAAQQVAKALEQAREAAKEAKKAAAQIGEKPRENPLPAKPSPLAEMQKQIAQQAAQQKMPDDTVKAAEAANQALQKGDLPMAIQQQQDALQQLQQTAQRQDEPMKGGTDQQPPTANAENAGQLAQAQKAVLEATRALQQSQQATSAAQAAVAQAQAQAPQAVQPQLEKAAQQLSQAGEQLGQGQPARAEMAQGQAAAELDQALQSLNAAAAATGQPQAQPGQSPTARASAAQPGKGRQPGQAKEPGMGQQPGMTPGQGMQPTDGMEENANQGKGQRTPDGHLKKPASQQIEARGDGSFIDLPQRQRDLIRQAQGGELPPQYSAMIKQYYLNLARTRPASAPK